MNIEIRIRKWERTEMGLVNKLLGVACKEGEEFTIYATPGCGISKGVHELIWLGRANCVDVIEARSEEDIIIAKARAAGKFLVIENREEYNGEYVVKIHIQWVR